MPRSLATFCATTFPEALGNMTTDRRRLLVGAFLTSPTTYPEATTSGPIFCPAAPETPLPLSTATVYWPLLTSGGTTAGTTSLLSGGSAVVRTVGVVALAEADGDDASPESRRNRNQTPPPISARTRSVTAPMTTFRGPRPPAGTRLPWDTRARVWSC